AAILSVQLFQFFHVVSFAFLCNSTSRIKLFDIIEDIRKKFKSYLDKAQTIRSLEMLLPISSIKQMVKVTWIQLAPFVKSVIVYFVIGSFEFFNSNVLSTILKCIPIICLMAFIFLMGFKFTNEYRHHQLILLGLIFSCAGDALLDYQKGILFQYGMLAFAVAQICYVAAFGWQPFRLLIGVIFYGLGALSLSLMFKNMEGILIFAVPIYCILLLTMGWRANARLQNLQNLPKLFTAIGAILFIISDGLIAFNMFYAPVKYSGILIMSTYYMAQLGITLSILDHDVTPKSTVKSN
ncbi:CLUMA_CG005308, isoform A, partial [Clunio marinus]